MIKMIRSVLGTDSHLFAPGLLTLPTNSRMPTGPAEVPLYEGPADQRDVDYFDRVLLTRAVCARPDVKQPVNRLLHDSSHSPANARCGDFLVRRCASAIASR